MSTEGVLISERHVDLMPYAPSAWSDAVSVTAWVDCLELPEALRRRDLESLWRAQLATLWWHFIEDLSVGLQVTEFEGVRRIRLGRVFAWHIYPDGTFDACHIDPSCGPRWYVSDVVQPLQPRWWVGRVLHRQHRLTDALEATLVERGWRHYPDPQCDYDPDAASQIVGVLWEWCVDRIVRRVRRARIEVAIRDVLLAAFDLDQAMIAIVLRARPDRRSSQQLPSSLWNRCVSFSTTFKQLDRYLPDSVPAFGAFVESGTTESSRVIADMLERMVTESLSRSPNEPQ